MFKLILCLSNLIGTAAMAAHVGHVMADRPANHGMAVFGHHKVYVSHLPMFHSPHDYQVIAEVEFDTQAKSIYDGITASDSELYTLAPDEDFVLPERVQAGNSFPATLFKGHFERGGTVIASGVQVKIKTVLYFKKFQPGEVKPDQAQYLYFGNELEQFLAHIITAKPDFDQIISIQATNALAPNDGVLLTLPGSKNDEPLKAPSSVIGISNQNSQEVNLQLLSNIYLESGDLSF